MFDVGSYMSDAGYCVLLVSVGFVGRFDDVLWVVLSFSRFYLVFAGQPRLGALATSLAAIAILRPSYGTVSGLVGSGGASVDRRK